MGQCRKVLQMKGQVAVIVFDSSIQEMLLYKEFCSAYECCLYENGMIQYFPQRLGAMWIGGHLGASDERILSWILNRPKNHSTLFAVQPLQLTLSITKQYIWQCNNRRVLQHVLIEVHCKVNGSDRGILSMKPRITDYAQTCKVLLCDGMYVLMSCCTSFSFNYSIVYKKYIPPYVSTSRVSWETSVKIPPLPVCPSILFAPSNMLLVISTWTAMFPWHRIAGLFRQHTQATSSMHWTLRILTQLILQLMIAISPLYSACRCHLIPLCLVRALCLLSH